MTTALARGGAERQWAALLPRLAARGIEPRLLTLQGRGDFFEEIAAAGIPAACAELRGRSDVAGLRRAFQLAGPRPDVVVSQGVDALVVGRLIAWRGHAAHAVVEHGGAGLQRRFHRRVLTRLVARRVDSLVAVSRSQLPGLQALGYPAARTVVIPNGVERPTTSRGRNEVRAEFGVAAGEFLAVFVGGLRPPKQPVAFVEAVALADVRGLVVGDGPLREAVAAAVASTDGRVKAVGERIDVPDLLLAADVVCLVSNIEALPMVVLEAMSAGRPVLASDVGGIGEAVVEGETGLLVTRGDRAALVDALRLLSGDEALARRLGEAGRIRYETLFSADRMADEYVSLLQRLTSAAT